VVTVSESLAGEVRRAFPTFAAKVQAVPNGVDDAFLKARSHFGAPGGETLELLAIGNLIPLKGVDRLIRALTQIAGSVPVRLTIVGDGTQHGELEALAAHCGVADRLRTRGCTVPWRMRIDPTVGLMRENQL
jgi:glycosyltransferase involved in cell wall biosynthesis